MGNWEKVFADGSPVRAEIVRSLLTEQGIAAVVLNKKESVYQIHGQYEVHVPTEAVLEAIKIVKNEITF